MSDVEFIARALCRALAEQPDDRTPGGTLKWVAMRGNARILLAELRTLRPGMGALLDGEAVVAPLDVADPEEPLSWLEWLQALNLLKARVCSLVPLDEAEASDDQVAGINNVVSPEDFTGQDAP
jgi:hypothetical protein